MATAEIIKLVDLGSALESFDVFICCSSFEERCYKIPEALESYDFKNVFICRNIDQLDLVDPYAQKIKSLYDQNSEFIDISSKDPITTADVMIRNFGSLRTSSPINYLIDITTFSHESLLILLIFLRWNLKSTDTVNFIYLPAKEYSEGDECEDKWLSKGTGSIRSILGYPGEIIPSRKNHLIILMGFEPHRAAELIEIYEPDIVSIGSPTEEDSINLDHYRTLIHKHIEFNDKIKNMYNNLKSFNFSCVDVDKTAESLNLQIASYCNYNTIIAPLNNKISTLGVGLFALTKPDVQLCYVTAKTYNTSSYSKPDDYCYKISIDVKAYNLISQEL